MPGNGMAKQIRRRLYSFARGIARPFTDLRRERFVREIIPGLLISGHVPADCRITRQGGSRGNT
jgi:hypothetical protein